MPPPVATDLQHAADDVAAGFAPLLAEARRLAHTIAAGAHGRRRAGPGESFWQHRPYGFGDPVNAIDWRQSARSADRLYVRQNEWEAAASIWLWRDPSASLDYASDRQGPTKRWRADVLAVALTILLSQAGERIGLIGGRDRPFHGRAAPNLLLQGLARADADPVPAIVRIRDEAHVVAFSDFFLDLDALREAVDGYGRQGARGVLVQITDPAEETFPFAGRTEFTDVETPRKITFGDAAALGADYRAAFAAHRAAVAGIAEAAGWTMIEHRTDAPATAALFALYEALSDAGPQPRRAGR